MASYPGSVVSLTSPSGTSLVSSGPDHAGLHTSINAEVIAMQTAIGTHSGTNVLKNFSAGNFPARINASNVLQQALEGTINNSTMGSPTITGGTIAAMQLIGTTQITGGTVSLTDLIGFYSTPQGTTVAAGGTATLDLNLTNEWRVTFGTGNATLLATNAVDGKKFIVSLTQDAVGTRTATWFSTIRWVNDGTPVLTTTANKRDTFGFIATGTNTYDGFIVGTNI